MAKPKTTASNHYYGGRKAAFILRSNGDDVVADIAFVAEDIRARTGQAVAWNLTGGETRVLWALAVAGAAAVIGLTTDEYIDAARAYAQQSTRPASTVAPEENDEVKP